jgi:triosephosphate isomerase (TIM)
LRIPLVVGNWKMNTTISQAITLVESLVAPLDKISSVEKVLCPPFISLYASKKLVKDSSIKVGAQNMFYKDKGAYTGEISPLMLSDLCNFVIIGHSERRQYFAENDELVSKKIKASFEFNINPILCVGETPGENVAGKAEEVISKQVKSALVDISPSDKLVIAYEPIWAIGTGKAATGNIANSTIAFIRGEVARCWGIEVSQAIRILYGGSVTGSNIAEFVAQSDIDGALVGGASLKADDFISIVSKTASIKTAK